MPGWSNVFYMTAVVYLVLNLQWMVWGTAKVQPWNFPPDDDPAGLECGAEELPAKQGNLNGGSNGGPAPNGTT